MTFTFQRHRQVLVHVSVIAIEHRFEMSMDNQFDRHATNLSRQEKIFI